VIVEIKVFSTLRQHVSSPEKRLEGDKWDIPEGESVAGVLKRLGLPKGQDKILMVNGRHVQEGKMLEDGDVLYIFPSLSGG
jgi:molybdopterin converting factor small subunit